MERLITVLILAATTILGGCATGNGYFMGATSSIAVKDPVCQQILAEQGGPPFSAMIKGMACQTGADSARSQAMLAIENQRLNEANRWYSVGYNDTNYMPGVGAVWARCEVAPNPDFVRSCLAGRQAAVNEKFGWQTRQAAAATLQNATNAGVACSLGCPSSGSASTRPTNQPSSMGSASFY